jgi:hypothetical protein
MLLGHLATLVPGGSPALRMNLLSALLDAVTVGVVFVIIFRLVAERGSRAGTPKMRPLALVAAATGALLLAFSTLFWAYSVVAEVFSLNNLFAAALLWLAIEWSWRPDRNRLLWLFMLVLGLALCNQQTIVLLVPAFAVLAWQGWKRLPRARGPLRIAPRVLGIAVAAFAAGLLPYVYLPIAASADPALNWGDPTNLHRFWADVSRKDYGSTSLVAGGKSGSIGENLQLLFTDLAKGFVFVGLLLVVGGLWWAWRHGRAEGAALLTAFVVAGPMFLVYAHPSYALELSKGVYARFFILPSIPLAVLGGLGAGWLLVRAARVGRRGLLRPGLVSGVAAAALLAVPAASALAHYSADDRSGNDVAANYGDDVLTSLAPNALLIMTGDLNYGSVTYAQVVAHRRSDVIALDSELLKSSSYVAQVRRRHPGLLIPFQSYDGGKTVSLNKLVAANLPARPVYYVGGKPEKRFGAPYLQLREGLVWRLVPKGSAPDPYAAIRDDPRPYERLHYPTHSYPASSWESAIVSAYGQAAFDVGFALDDGSATTLAAAERLYRRAIRLDPQQTSAYKDLGLLLYHHGGDPTEIVTLWKKYLGLVPKDPQAPAIRGALAKLEAKIRSG